MKYSRILQGAAGLALAGAGFYLFFRKAGSGDDAALGTLAKEVSHTGIPAAAICVLLTLLAAWLRAVRLGILLPGNHAGARNPPDQSNCQPCPPNPPKRHKRGLFSVILVSLMASNILPARLGEAARVILLRRRNGYPVAVGVGAFLAEHALDMAVYLAFLVIPLWASPALASGLRSLNPAAPAIVWALTAALLLLVALFVLYALAPEIFKAAAARMAAPLPPKIKTPVQKTCADLESGMNWIFSAAGASKAALLSIAIALCYALMLTVLAGGFGAFGIFPTLFAQSTAAFGAAIPLVPGGVGTLHAALLHGLALAGVDPGKARAVAVLYHGIQYVVITGAGLLCLAAMNVRLRDIAKS